MGIPWASRGHPVGIPWASNPWSLLCPILHVLLCNALPHRGVLAMAVFLLRSCRVRREQWLRTTVSLILAQEVHTLGQSNHRASRTTNARATDRSPLMCGDLLCPIVPSRVEPCYLVPSKKRKFPERLSRLLPAFGQARARHSPLPLVIHASTPSSFVASAVAPRSCVRIGCCDGDRTPVTPQRRKAS